MVPQHSAATLLCPHARGNVSWSRYVNGNRVPLLSIINGKENRADPRYSSRANTALVISRVEASDTSLYLCNGEKTVYLEVSTDRSVAAAQPEETTATQRKNGPKPEELPGSSWRVPVRGVAAGASLVMVVVVFAVMFCSARRKPSRDATSEAIYEEISMEPERPHSGSSRTLTPSPSLYSVISTQSSAHCLYSLAQTPDLCFTSGINS